MSWSCLEFVQLWIFFCPSSLSDQEKLSDTVDRIFIARTSYQYVAYFCLTV